MKLNPTIHQANEVSITCLTSDEENAVRYAAGYVERKIKEALKSPQDEPALDVLSQLIASSEAATSSSTSQELPDRISCGGLINITDKAFQCLYAIEYCI